VCNSCIQLFNVYGKIPNSSYKALFLSFLRGINGICPLVIYRDGEQTGGFIHVSDVADTIIIAMECGEVVGKTFNCETGGFNKQACKNDTCPLRQQP